MLVKLTSFNMRRGAHQTYLVNPASITAMFEVLPPDKRNPDANTSVYVEGFDTITAKESLEQIAIAMEVAFKQRKEV